MDFGMPTLIELDSLSDTVSLCKALGLRFVELNMNLPWYQPDKLSAEYKEWAPKWKALAELSGAKIDQ